MKSIFEREKYLNGLKFSASREQVEVITRLSDNDFARWLDLGRPEATINNIIEREHRQSRIGQKPPSSEQINHHAPKDFGAERRRQGFTHDELGLEYRPMRAPTYLDDEAGSKAVLDFYRQFQQLAPIQSNFDKIGEFLRVRGSRVTVANLRIAFETLFPELTLRTVEHRVVQEEAAPKSSEPEVRKRMLTRFGLVLDAKPKKQRRQSPNNSNPTARTEDVEVLYLPQDVKRFSADMTKRFMAPMQFTGVTANGDIDITAKQSADEYYRNHKELHPTEMPPLLQKRLAREIASFMQSDYARAAQQFLQERNVDGEWLSKQISAWIAKHDLPTSDVTLRQTCEAVLASISITINPDKGSTVRHTGSVMHDDHGFHEPMVDQLPLGKTMAGQHVASPYNPEKVWTEQAVRRELRVLNADQLRERMADKAFVDALDKLPQ